MADNNVDWQDVSQWDVLIVDDEPDNSGVVQHIFMFHDVSYRSGNSGARGLELLRERRPTFLLLDIQMPRMSGWDVLKVIREDLALHDLVVIAMTAHAMAGDRDRIIAAGFDGYIPKPISPFTFIDELKSILRAYVNRKSEEKAP